MQEKNRDGLLKISEFSKIAEISRKGLIFYDNIGVFSPEYTAPNGYRYYSHEQIYLISVVNMLKELDTPLSHIRDYMQDCTPDHAVALLQKQGAKLEQKINQLQSIQNMLQVKLARLEAGMARTVGSIRVVEQAETPLFISDPFEAEKSCIPDDTWIGFYMKCRKHRVAFGYPEGFMVSRENLQAGRTDIASHIICHVGKAQYANAFMPAGRYLTACAPGSFADIGPVYQALLDYAGEHQLRISGNAYEERLIDEIASREKESQRIEVRIMIA